MSAKARLVKLRSICYFEILAATEENSHPVVQRKTRYQIMEQPEKQNLHVGRDRYWKEPENMQSFPLLFLTLSTTNIPYYIT